MSEWKEYKLGDIINVKHGYAFKGENFSDKPTSDILVTPGNFNIGGGFKQSKFKYHTGEYPLSYILSEGDIIVTMTDLSKEGDTLGYSAKIPQHENVRYLHNQRIGLLQFKNDDFIKDYIYWVLRSREYQRFIVNSATGSTVKHTSPSRIHEFILKAPSESKQTVIAEILSSLDDKIELNNKINQELESIAQLLFKRWFVDFEFPNENGEPYKSSGGEMIDSELGEIPKGWKLDKLEKIVTKSHTGADAITRAPIVDYDTGIKCARVGDLTNKRSYLNWAFCKINPQDYERHKLEEGDIIVTRTATLGINQLVRKSIDAVCNNGLIRLKLDKKVCHPNFVFIQLQSDSYKEYIERISGDSSTRPNMQMDYLLDFKIILPESSLVIKFSELLNNIYNQIDACKLENEALVNTRDTLLPKLISGELQINEN